MPGRKSGRQRWQDFVDLVKEVYCRFCEDRIALAAGAVSFFTVLSLVPLLLLAVNFAAKELAVLLQGVKDSLGQTFYLALLDQIIFVRKINGFSTVVALIFGFWSGSQVFLILESAMNLAWNSERKRPLWLRRGVSLLMVLVAGTLMSVAMLLVNLIRILASFQIPLWGHQVGELPFLVPTLLTTVLPILLVSTLFASIYRIMPTKRVSLRAVIPGALFAGTLWLISLHLFGWYVVHFGQERYFVFYKTFSGIVLLMFWLYYSAFIILLGAEISATHHRRLVEAGDQEERMLEENAQVSAKDQQGSHWRARKEEAAEAVLYYGYRSEE